LRSEFRKERHREDAEGPSRFAVGPLLDGTAWGVPAEDQKTRGPKNKLKPVQVGKLVSTLKKLHRTPKGDLHQTAFECFHHTRVSPTVRRFFLVTLFFFFPLSNFFFFHFCSDRCGHN
jgi:hypothetical protein